MRARARIAYLRVIFEDDADVEVLLDESEEFLKNAEELFEDDLSEATYYLRAGKSTNITSILQF